MDYLLHVLTLVLLYSLLAVSLEIVIGQTGLVSLAQAALFATGAYTSAVLVLRLDLPVMLAVPCGVVAGAIGAIPLILLSTRLRHDQFVIASFAFQVVVTEVLSNLDALTGGVAGLTGVPRPQFLGVLLRREWQYLLLVLLLAAVGLVVAWRAVNSAFGRLLRAVREGELWALSMGRRPGVFRAHSLLLAGGLAGLAGALYAHHLQFLHPSDFDFRKSILIVSMIALGGLGRISGAILGAWLLILLPEVFRRLGLPDAFAANLREALYGVCLIAIVLWRPKGVVGNFDFARQGWRR